MLTNVVCQASCGKKKNEFCSDCSVLSRWQNAWIAIQMGEQRVWSKTTAYVQLSCSEIKSLNAVFKFATAS